MQSLNLKKISVFLFYARMLLLRNDTPLRERHTQRESPIPRLPLDRVEPSELTQEALHRKVLLRSTRRPYT